MSDQNSSGKGLNLNLKFPMNWRTYAQVIGLIMVLTVAAHYGLTINNVSVTSGQILDAANLHVGSSYSLFTRDYSYIIAHPLGDDSLYCLQNGTTGALQTYGTNKTGITEMAVGNLTAGGGSILLKGFRKPNGLTQPTNVRIVESYQEQERTYQWFGLVLPNVGARVSKNGLVYLDSGDGAYTAYMTHDAPADQYISMWTLEQPFGFGTYQFKAKISVDNNTDIGFIFGFEWHHGRAGDGIIAFRLDIGDYKVQSSYAQNATQTIIAGQDWKTERTLKIEWTSTYVKFYVDDALEATHTTNVPQYPACFFIESYTIGAPGVESFLKIRNFEEIVP